MSCYETETTYSCPPLAIRYPVPVDWSFSPFGILPYTSRSIPRPQNLYTVPYDPGMVKYGKSTYVVGGVNGIKLHDNSEANCGRFTRENAYLTSDN